MYLISIGTEESGKPRRPSLSTRNHTQNQKSWLFRYMRVCIAQLLRTSGAPLALVATACRSRIRLRYMGTCTFARTSLGRCSVPRQAALVTARKCSRTYQRPTPHPARPVSLARLPPTALPYPGLLVSWSPGLLVASAMLRWPRRRHPPHPSLRLTRRTRPSRPLHRHLRRRDAATPPSCAAELSARHHPSHHLARPCLRRKPPQLGAGTCETSSRRASCRSQFTLEGM